MRSSTAMNSSGLSMLPCLSPILTSNAYCAPSPTTTLAVVFSYMPSTILTSTVASPLPSLWVLCQKLSPSRRTPEPYCPVPPVSSLPSVSGRTSRLLFLSPSWTLAVLPRSHLLLFSWSLRLKLSPAVSVLGWVVWCPCTFLGHVHPLSSSISALSGPSSTPSVSFSPAYTRSVAFVSTWLPPLQPSPSPLAALRLPLSPCLFSSCAFILLFSLFLSYLLHFHLSLNRARELEATCCSCSIQLLLVVSHPYPQHLISVMSLPRLELRDLHMVTLLRAWK